MKSFRTLTTLVVFLLCANAHADIIKGVVKDAAGIPIPGAAVMIQGTTQGVSTDLDGNFTIDVVGSSAKTLEITCIGLQTQVIKIGSKTYFDVVMQDDANFLDETVVIGYATVKRRDVMGSVTSVAARPSPQPPWPMSPRP